MGDGTRSARLTSAYGSHNIPALVFPPASAGAFHFLVGSNTSFGMEWNSERERSGAPAIKTENDIQLGSIFHPHRIPDDVSSTKNLNPSPPKLCLSVRSHASHSRRIPLLTIARIAPRIVKTETLPDHCLHYSFLCYYFRRGNRRTERRAEKISEQ